MLQAKGSTILLLFSLLEYAVHKASYRRSNFPYFPISSNINSRQNGAKMYPSRDVTFVSALMNSFMLYVKRSIVTRMLIINSQPSCTCNVAIFLITIHICEIWLHFRYTCKVSCLFMSLKCLIICGPLLIPCMCSSISSYIQKCVQVVGIT